VHARIVLYCRSGNIIAQDADTLVGLGYTDAWDLRCEMIAWEEACFGLEGA
jgi:rhodanese-related sulfurtransferase